ncbi:MAG: hypothetical protein ABJF10_25195 [Chthoniobacter sp.]|uniref:hypothetical protein n=1 Tax=Chthoniobacter sp. TaxID=2510640 RepID=UPI0032AB028D
MKTVPLFRILLVLLALLTLARGDDKLISIDLNGSVIIVQQQNSLKTIHFKPFTEITINGAKATAGQLKPGMLVTVGLADPQNATKIAARGNAGDAGAAATPAPAFTGFASTQATRRIVIKALVDARDHWTIQNGKLSIQHFEFKQPVDIVINGVKWAPTWTNNTTDEFTAFTPPLASFAGSNLSIKKTKGRGDVTILEPPTEANGYKLVFRLQDKGAGANEHEVHITW